MSHAWNRLKDKDTEVTATIQLVILALEGFQNYSAQMRWYVLCMNQVGCSKVRVTTWRSVGYNSACPGYNLALLGGIWKLLSTNGMVAHMNQIGSSKVMVYYNICSAGMNVLQLYKHNFICRITLICFHYLALFF